MNQDHTRLQAAIDAARASEVAGGAIWRSLSAEFGNDAWLASALRELHGLEVCPAATALGPLRGAAAGVGLGTATADGLSLLVCDDPWSEGAARWLARQPVNAALALSRPGLVVTAVPTATPTARGMSDAGGSEIVRFVDAAIRQARATGASDIHFETDRHGLRVKYRLDGVMTAGPAFADPARVEEVISRIKVMAHLDITERRRPQDGRIHWEAADHPAIDLRVSIMPSIFGEDAVLRLLDKAQLQDGEQALSLERLGFDGAVADVLRDLAARPHGMLLMTGPTGSGKTTTVYAALTEVDTGLEKIVTIEDPVEYELPGVLQIPVNEQKGLTFATGLRSILRHDPDKILVGEIRDAETAQIAVQSALTGHLVFTTVHANSLFDVLGRFQHFGIESLALASALNGVVVQRLLRKACPHCTGWRPPSPAEARRLEQAALPVPARLPAVGGCPACRDTGYRGRFVVAEVHVLHDALRDLMVQGASLTELKRVAYARPDDRLIARAMRHVERGETTLEDVIRVVGLA
ncbi:MAG: type II/IV secretion system protein [Burkholderiales bacterium]|nr:type II/IV secretion system protein [Burkholderiales bacterium]